MSFGCSCSDVVLLAQLAWKTVRNSRKACGEYAELTCKTTSLHVNLQRLEREIAKPESPINRPSDTCRQELAPIISGCGKVLGVLDRILKKYNALSDGDRRGKKLWKAVRFGNGELANVKDIQLKLGYYTSSLSLFLNMVSLGSMGVVEKQTREVGGNVKEIRRAVGVLEKQTYEVGGNVEEILRATNNITAQLIRGANKEGSVLTDYADDDKAVWRALRRELVSEGFSSDAIQKHKHAIKAYVKDLGSSGIFDDEGSKDSGNVSEEIEDTNPTQATPESRDQATGSFESDSGAARDAVNLCSPTTAHTDNSFGTGSGDQKWNGTISKRTQIRSANLTTNNVPDTLPFITQADTDINSLAESDSGEVEIVDDRTYRRPSPATIPFAQSLPEIAETNTWFKGPFDSKPTSLYYEYHDKSRSFLHTRSACYAEDFERLSNPLLARGKTLEFQAEANSFLKVAELRTELQNPWSSADRKSLLKLSSLFHDPKQGILFRVLLVIDKGHPNNIMNGLMQWGVRSVDACPEKWRITEWPLPREETEREGHGDGDKGEHSISTTFSMEGGQAHAPPTASAPAEDTRPSEHHRTSESSEMDRAEDKAAETRRK